MRRRKRGRQTSVCGCLSHTPPTRNPACNPGTCPDWESNGNPLVHRLALNPLSHTSQGGHPFLPYFFHSCVVFLLSSVLTNIIECSWTLCSKHHSGVPEAGHSHSLEPIYLTYLLMDSPAVSLGFFCPLLFLSPPPWIQLASAHLEQWFLSFWVTVGSPTPGTV